MIKYIKTHIRLDNKIFNDCNMIKLAFKYFSKCYLIFICDATREKEPSPQKRILRGEHLKRRHEQKTREFTPTRSTFGLYII